jgi:hypothetical protein
MMGIFLPGDACLASGRTPSDGISRWFNRFSLCLH